MKIILVIVSVLFLVSCTDENTTQSLAPIVNDYYGHYVVNLSGDFIGAATIAIRQNGKIENGIPVLFYNTFNLNLYINGYVNKEGNIEANFYCKQFFVTETSTFIISSSSGYFNGSFNSGSGNYSISITNDQSYSGTWSAIKY